MSDAGEGLIDADSRIQERMEELERERNRKTHRYDPQPNREFLHAHESLRLARTELTGQLEATTHERRRAQIAEAIAELDRRMKEMSAPA
jgi:hypothetical protein